MKEYIVTVHSDVGQVKIRTSASTMQAAMDMVCMAELCPPAAVHSIFDSSDLNKSVAWAITNFVYFTNNFYPDFIEKVWSGNLAIHLRSKFETYSGSKGYISAGDFISFFLNLDRGNQFKLALWIENNYHSFSDHGKY